MGQLFSPGLQAKRIATIRKVRELSIPGTVTVGVGDRVRAGDIVAYADQAGEVLMLRVAEKLGIDPSEVERGLRVSVGQSIAAGQVVCEHAGLFGLFRSTFIAPADGVVDFVTARTGHIGLRLPSKRLELNAYIDGTVVEVVPGKGVTLETRGAIIQGIFGVGGERVGTLAALPIPPHELISEEHVAGLAPGTIVIGGTCPSGAALRAAAARGVVGMIVGSIDDRALAEYLGYDLGIALTGDEAVSMSVIVTEGFGTMPMAERTRSLLTGFAGRRASINGATQVRAGALRPEILVPHGEGGDEDVDATLRGLVVGAPIRLIRVPYFGLRATVVELPREAARIDTGAFARVLVAQLQDGRRVVVPRANVEIAPEN